MVTIDIFTTLAPNSAPYAEALCKNLNSLKSGKHTLRFWALIAKRDIDNCGLPKGWSIISINTDKVQPIGVSKPSVNHAKLLNQIEHHIPGDSDVTIITDCDMFVFPHNWDEFIVKRLYFPVGKPLDCIGTEKHDGSLRMFFIAFPTFVYLALQPDFMPGDGDYVSKLIYDKVLDKNVVGDTGWQLGQLLVGNEKDFLSLPLVVDKYYYNGQLFCAHLGGSHKKGFKSKEVKAWYENCKNQIY